MTYNPNTGQFEQGFHDYGAPGGAGDSDFGDLDTFTDYKPEAAFGRGLETLADGSYDFEVRGAVLEKTQKTGDRICRLTLQVLGGRPLEWTCWLNQQSSVNTFCANLAALGFDADRWGTPQRPLSKEIPTAVAKLPGIKFRGVKSSRKDTRPGKDDKVYHDLAVSCRIAGQPMPALTPPPSNVPSNGPAPVASGGSPVPF